MATHVTADSFGRNMLRHAVKTQTYAVGAGTGTAGTPVVLFTVTGEVQIVMINAFCTTLLTESGATATMGADHAEKSRGTGDQMWIATRLIWLPSRLPKKYATTIKTPAIAAANNPYSSAVMPSSSLNSFVSVAVFIRFRNQP
jgi:hypothetical protein